MNEMMKDLAGVVRFNSVSVPGDEENPFGSEVHDALEYMLDLCERFGFRTARCGNLCGYAEIGEGEKMVGILAHLDIVPAGNGWNTNPFEMVIKEDGKAYGRGVIDDKGPAVAAVYAMKDILDSGAKLNSRVRIIFGCSEEAGGWKDMHYYCEHEELPTVGFTPDAEFPVINGEKGIGKVLLKMKLADSGVLSVKGGTVANMVPDYAECTMMKDGREQHFEAKGKAAHGSMPSDGINAIGLLMKEIDCPLAEMYNRYLGMTCDGKLLGCHFQDEQSGEITVNAGLIDVIDDDIVITLNIRCPVTFTEQNLIEAIQKKIEGSLFTAELTGWSKPVYHDVESPLIKTLVAAYTKITGRVDEPKVIGGGTYAKAMDNIVAFGPVLPGRECTEHQPNECIYVEDLELARKIYKEAIERLTEI